MPDRFLVHRSRGLVHDEDTGLAQEGTGQTEQLALTNAEILTILSHKEIFQEKKKYWSIEYVVLASY